MTQPLIDTFDFKPILVESDNNTGLTKFEGLGQRYDARNQNGRIYPKTLWEKLKANPSITEKFQNRKSVGQLGHPTGSPDPEKISHVITDFWIGEGGDVYVKGEIVNTPSGKILEGLLKSGITLGISSRGSGSVKRINDADIVQEDFNLETWDWVINPSTVNAYPKLREALEQLDFKKENYMNSREQLALYKQKAKSVLSLKPSDVTEAFRPTVEMVAEELVIELTKLGTEAPELKNLTESLITDLNSKKREICSTLVESAPPFMKKDKDEKEEKDDDKEEKKEKKDKVEVKDVKEETSGSADQGFHRSVPKEAVPPAGEGWPLNPSDAGVLAGINDGVDEFMSKAEPIPEEAEYEETEFSEAKDEEEDKDDEEVEESAEMTRTESLIEIASKIVSTPRSEANEYARAFAAAFLMENSKRVNESGAFSRIIEKLQIKIAEAAQTGEFVLSEDNEYKEKYEATLAALEEIQLRHRLLSAKVYAESELRKLGLEADANARKVVSEAIRKAATRTSIDEAIAILVPIKGLKVEKKEIKESAAPSEKTAEGIVAAINESEKAQEVATRPEGAALGRLLSNKLNFSRSVR